MKKLLIDKVLGNEEIKIECPNGEIMFAVTLGQVGETNVEQALNDLESTLDSF